MERHLVLVLPSKNSNEFPYDYETADMMYGSMLEEDFSRLTFVDIEGGFATVGDLPEGIAELLEEKGKVDLIESARVVSIQGMDPLRKDWGSLIRSYFRPLLPSGSGEVEVTYQLGPGSALLTGMMVGLASSTESKIIVNSPFDEEGESRVNYLDFVKMGSQAYSVLFGGSKLGKAPSKDTAFQRNILVRLFEERTFFSTHSNPDGKWMSARDLSSWEGMPKSAQGIAASAEVLVNLGLVLKAGGEKEDFGTVAMTYSLTAEGIVAALETRRHHNSAFMGAYDPVTRNRDSTPSPVGLGGKRARGVILGFRIDEETSEVSQEDSEEQANRVLNSFDFVCPVVCHIGAESQSRFISLDPVKKWQKNIHETVVRQRKKGLHDSIFYSICGPDWSPKRHFSSVIDSMIGLPANVDWSTDITRLSSWDQVIFSIASNLLEIPLIYTARDRGKGARGGKAKAPDDTTISQVLLHVELPSHSTWRLVRDLSGKTIPDSMSKLPLILSSINAPSTDFVISMDDFNRITGLKDKERSRVASKLDVPRTFVTEAYDSGEGKVKIGWKLTESGVIASEFIKANRRIISE